MIYAWLLSYYTSNHRWEEGESVKENTALKIKTDKILNPNRIDCDKHCVGGLLDFGKDVECQVRGSNQRQTMDHGYVFVGECQYKSTKSEKMKRK